MPPLPVLPCLKYKVYVVELVVAGLSIYIKLVPAIIPPELENISVKTPTEEPPLYKAICGSAVAVFEYIIALTKTKTLLEELDGVIDAEKLVVTNDVEVVDICEEEKLLTTCKTLPADACVAEPVAVATGYVMPVSPFKISAMLLAY